MKTLAAILTGDSAAKDKAFAEGLYIAGNRYVLAKADDEEGLYARSVWLTPCPALASLERSSLRQCLPGWKC
jgi:hypothetical protein